MRAGAAALSVAALVLLLTLLALLLLVAVMSFSADSYMAFPPSGFSLRRFEALVQNAPMLKAARSSVILASTVTMIAPLVGVPAALAVARGLAFLLALQPLALVATWPGLVLAHLVVVLPFVTRIMATSLAALLADLEAAAATLGASPLRAFWRITLSLALAGVIASATLRSWSALMKL